MARRQAPRLNFLLEAFDEQQGIDAFDGIPYSGVDAPPAGARTAGAERMAAAAAKSLGKRASSSSAVGRVASTTGKRFTQDMSTLMAELQATTSHFVHCVKPNAMEQPELLSYELVAEQLTSLGTLEVVQLMGLGFPVRIKYGDLRERYLPRLKVQPPPPHHAPRADRPPRRGDAAASHCSPKPSPSM